MFLVGVLVAVMFQSVVDVDVDRALSAFTDAGSTSGLSPGSFPGHAGSTPAPATNTNALAAADVVVLDAHNDTLATLHADGRVIIEQRATCEDVLRVVGSTMREQRAWLREKRGKRKKGKRRSYRIPAAYKGKKPRKRSGKGSAARAVVVHVHVPKPKRRKPSKPKKSKPKKSRGKRRDSGGGGIGGALTSGLKL